MAHANEHTDWASQDGPGEAKLTFKEPQAEHDPNIGTEWAPPVDDSKPRPRVPREIDKYLNEPMWTCQDCGHPTMTATGKAAHLAVGGDGMTPCQRGKANFKPVKNCNKCGGTGRGTGQCPSCNGGGEKCAECSGSGRAASCVGCNGTGKVQGEDGPHGVAIDEDALAQKIAAPIIKSMTEGFEMLARALSGKPMKAKKKAKAARGGTKGVSRVAPPRGSEPVSGLEQPDVPVGDSPSEPEEA